MGGEPSRASFWTTLPGILTGIAALITALVTAAAFLLSGESKDSPPVRKALGTKQIRQEIAPASNPGLPPAVRRLTVGRSPFSPASGLTSTGGGGDIVWVSGQLNLYGTRNAVATGEPGKDSCVEVLQRRSDGYLQRHQLQQGAVVCVSTPDRVVAQIGISPPDVHDKLPIDVTVWR